ncbi:MAG: hypothetical protein Q8880_03695 [Bacteroidota bacterium]|nr:hypothetical protein [Bacteroidota bacterium]
MRFREVIGQEGIKKRLINSVKNNRISHAQLFLGSNGSGDLPLAIAYAQFICCENKQDDDSCGECPSCKKFNKLIHPDLHFVYPVATTQKVTKKPLSIDFIADWRNFISKDPYQELNKWYEEIGIENKQGIINAEDCNEIIRKLNLKSFESEYKIVIMWMVEKLFHAAAPKLLKILEEPPEKTLFILISRDQDQILKTILSRSQLIKIPRISDDEMYNYLVSNSCCSEAEAENIVKLAYGDYSEAKKLLSDTESLNFNFINFRNWLLMCYSKKFPEIISWGDEFSKIGREKLKSFLSYGLHIFRECLMINNGAENLTRLIKEELEFATKFSRFVNNSNSIALNEEFNKASYHIERNANAKIVLLDLSIKVKDLLFQNRK